MKKKLHCTFLLITALGLVSCASTKGFPDRVVSVDEELTYLRPYFQKVEVDKYYTANDDDARKRIRGDIINSRIAGIDIEFSQFQQGLHELGVSLNVGTDAVMLGLGAAGALASGGTSQVLSAASAAVTGLKGSIDKNAFYEQAMPALFAKMIAKRKMVLVNIRKGLTKAPSEYPLQQGIADLEEYRYAGTVPGAISAVIENSGAQLAQADEELANISIYKGGIEHSDETAFLKNWFRPNGIRNKEREYRAKEWLKKDMIGQNFDLATIMLASSHDDPKLAELRNRLMNAINNGELGD